MAILFLIFKNDGFAAKNRFRHAKLEGYWSGRERRQHPRFTQSLAISYSVLKKSIAKNISGKTIDISEGGAKLLLDEKLPLGTALSLKILLPNSGNTAEVAGDIVWTEDAAGTDELSGKRFFYSGVKFSSIKEPFGKNFIDYIRSIPADQES
ncbi:MAG: PilZ domain-containing protein [Candidatus Omnitrophota bacterium]